jgi:hypothetical protein
VTDFAFPAASFAADITGTPYVVIYHSGLPFRGDGIPLVGAASRLAPAGRKPALRAKKIACSRGLINASIRREANSAWRPLPRYAAPPLLALVESGGERDGGGSAPQQSHRQHAVRRPCFSKRAGRRRISPSINSAPTASKCRLPGHCFQ